MGIFGKPTQVVWSADNPEHRLHKESNPFGGRLYSKSIHNEFVLLYVNAPEFKADKVSLRFSVSNRGEKALGFGAAGIGLRTDTDERNCINFAASPPFELSRMGSNVPIENVNGRTTMVDAEQGMEFVAEFAPMSQQSRVGVAIEAKRIFVPNYLFMILFEF